MPRSLPVRHTKRVTGTDYMTFVAVGKLTHEDYEVITPVIDSALDGVKNQRIKALIAIRDLDGWEARAAWPEVSFDRWLSLL